MNRGHKMIGNILGLKDRRPIIFLIISLMLTLLLLLGTASCNLINPITETDTETAEEEIAENGGDGQTNGEELEAHITLWAGLGPKERLALMGRVDNYMVPFRSFDFLTLFYNKDLVDESPASFEEVIEYSKEVNNFGSNIYGLLLNAGPADWIIPFIGGYEDWIVDYSTNSLTLDNQATVKTLEFLSYIYNEEGILPFNIEYGEINELFKNGNVHMIIDNTQLINEYREAGLNLGIVKIPLVWQGDEYPTPLISGIGFMINVNCYGNELAAVNDFMQYMLSEEVQIDWTLTTDTFPVLKNIDRNETLINNEIIYNAFQQV